MKRQPRRDARDPYRERRHGKTAKAEFEARPFWASLKWLALGVGVVLAVVVGVWALGVLSAGPKGAGDVHRANESARNRIQQQGNFVQLRQDYVGALAKITVAAGELKAAKGDKRAEPQRRVELNGLRQNCVDIAQQYNADSQKVTAKDWKSAGLPATLDPARCAKG